jgi:hypothetical protein
MQIRRIARWSEREDIILCFDGGVEIPAVQAAATGRIYFYDGRGCRRTLDITDAGTLVLDAFQKRRDFKDPSDFLAYIEAETGPAPRGRATIVGQVGAEFVYALSPATTGGSGE